MSIFTSIFGLLFNVLLDGLFSLILSLFGIGTTATGG